MSRCTVSGAKINTKCITPEFSIVAVESVSYTSFGLMSDKKGTNQDSSSNAPGAGGQGKKQKGPAKVKQAKAADSMANISNGIQRLQIASKHPQPDQKTSPTVEPQQHHNGKLKSPGVQGKGAAGRPKSANLDAAFAKKDLYAGAAFDNSPAAATLPIPKFGASKTTSDMGTSVQIMRSISVEELMGSGKSLSVPSSSQMTSPLSQLSDAEQLRMKSEYLMKYFTSAKEQPGPHKPERQPAEKPSPNTEQLEQMTAEVRKMLNL